MNYARILKEADPKFASQLEKIDRGFLSASGKPSLCWEFTGGKFANGYGRVHGKDSGEIKAHRHSYVLVKGAVGKKNGKARMVLHKCDNRACCNPSHLYVGDHRRNMKDMTDRGRQARGETSPRSMHKELEVSFAKLLLSLNFSYTDVQDMMLLSRTTVGRFANDAGWIHVGPMPKKKQLIVDYIANHRLATPFAREAHGWNAHVKPLSVRCVRELVSVFGQVEVALMLNSTRKIIRTMLEQPDTTTYQVNPQSKRVMQDDPNQKIRDFILREIERMNTCQA